MDGLEIKKKKSENQKKKNNLWNSWFAYVIRYYLLLNLRFLSCVELDP